MSHLPFGAGDASDSSREETGSEDAGEDHLLHAVARHRTGTLAPPGGIAGECLGLLRAARLQGYYVRTLGEIERRLSELVAAPAAANDAEELLGLAEEV